MVERGENFSCGFSFLGCRRPEFPNRGRDYGVVRTAVGIDFAGETETPTASHAPRRPPVAYVARMLGNFPIPLHRRAWRCHTCDVEWEDDGLPDSAESEQ